jgi:histidinol-phosphate aminotransferase
MSLKTDKTFKIQPKSFLTHLKPYRPAFQDESMLMDDGNMLKLDSNESTEKPSPLVSQAINEFLAKGYLNRYPDMNATQLRKKLSDYTKRSLEEIQVFNGSDSALDYIARTFVGEEDKVIIASPTYDNFRLFVELLGARVEFVYSKIPFTSDVSGLLSHVDSKTKMIYLCNPNNPTGVLYSKRDVRRILEALERNPLIVDEAYFEYTGLTMSDLLDEYENLIITRSFSKAFGLASLRCGYILSNRVVIEYIETIRNGKDVNTLAQIAASAALDDTEYMENYVKVVQASKTWLAKQLQDRDLEVIITPANYILIRVDFPRELIASLRDQEIYIRDRSNIPQMQNIVRITVGNLELCEKFLRALDKHLFPGS